MTTATIIVILIMIILITWCIVSTVWNLNLRKEIESNMHIAGHENMRTMRIMERKMDELERSLKGYAFNGDQLLLNDYKLLLEYFKLEYQITPEKVEIVKQKPKKA